MVLRRFFLLIVCLLVCQAVAFAAFTERVSVSSTGGEGNAHSLYPAISADARYVAFQSEAGNLVDGDTNGRRDIFVHDRATGTTARVSVSSAGEEGNGHSSYAAISADGRYVAFYSEASNLVDGDNNGLIDAFVHDRATGTTERVSVSSTGCQANGRSYVGAISADGRYVAFESRAANLVPGDTNLSGDVFVRDRAAGTTERVSVNSAGLQGNEHSYVGAISADGRYVAFCSSASNLVAGDTNARRDVFVHDRATGSTERVSIGTAGLQANGDSYVGAISADGRYVAFYSKAFNLVAGDTNSRSDIFVHDRATGTTERVSMSSAGEEGNNHSSSPAISAEGRYVAFRSEAGNLVAGDTNHKPDIFVHDRATGTTERVSVSTAGEEGNSHSSYPAISADGSYVAFQSSASDLVPGDTNGEADIFVTGPADVTLGVGEARAFPAGTATVPVSLSETADIAGIQFDLDYAPSLPAPLLELIAVRAVGPAADWTVDVVEMVAGKHARVIAYSSTLEELPSGSGPVLELDFLLDRGAVIGDIYTLHPWDILLSDRLGELIKRVEWEDGRVAVAGTVVRPDQFHFEHIPSPQGADTTCPLPFPVRIEARYANGSPAPTYNGTAYLAPESRLVLASVAGVTVPPTTILPAEITFYRGVWEGPVGLLGDQGSPSILTVTDQAHPRLTGDSNSFTVRVKGDPTDDGEVDVLDVLRTVSIALGREVPTPPPLAFQSWAGDMNCDVIINVQDVVLVVHKSLDLSGAAVWAPQRASLAEVGLPSASSAERTISIEPDAAQVREGESFPLTIALDEAVGAAGYQFDVSYNGALTQFVPPARLGTLLTGRGWSLYTNQINPNLARVLAYNPTAAELPAGSGSLVVLDFQAAALGETALVLQSVVLSSGLGTFLPVVGHGASVDVLLFFDVASGHWAASEIEACVQAGVVSGYGDGTYQPGTPVTRDQMAVYISRALAGGDGNVPEFTDTPTFTDVDAEHWALDYVEYAFDENVVTGYDDGLYHPEYEVTRDQMAVYVARALVAPEGEAGLAGYVPADPRDFPDVASDFWAYKHVEYCVENGVVAGYEDGYYHPEMVVTRDQMAVYVARAFGLM